MASRAPAHLRPDTAAWWRSVCGAFDLEPHHKRLLLLAAEAFDRSVQVRETLAREGCFYTDRFGCPHAHPAAALERDSRLAFARLVRQLDLDDEPASSRGRVS